MKKIESSRPRCSVKKVFLKISQNSWHHLCRSLFSIEFQAYNLQLYQIRDYDTVFL